jgi:DNA processing protein
MSAGACAECASRAILLGLLAAHIDRSVDRRAGDRARDLLSLDDHDLGRAVAGGDGAGCLRRARSRTAHEALAAALAATGCWSTCRHAPDYPPALLDLGASGPRAVFGAGSRRLLRDLDPGRSATIVGSRRAGAYGRDVAGEMARLLASTGIDIVSGMALGVDSAAHEGALAGAGTTVAVLGTGAERPYPRSRRRLYERVRERGAVISELPPGVPTFRWMFPARNRLMAVLADVTVVVEAAERSGSLITAEMAIDAGRQVGAVPGPVNSWRSSGSNKLLAEGAAVIRGAQDVLDLLLGPGTDVGAGVGPPHSEVERSVLDAVEGGATTPGAAATAAGAGFADAQAALGALERHGYVAATPTGRYSRTALGRPPPPAHG